MTANPLKKAVENKMIFIVSSFIFFVQQVLICQNFQYQKDLKLNMNIIKKHIKFLKITMVKKNLMTEEKKWQKCQEAQN